MNLTSTLEETETFEVMLDLLIKKLIEVQTEFELKRGITLAKLRKESEESKRRKELLGRLLRASDGCLSRQDEISVCESIINGDLKQEYADAIIKAKNTIQKMSTSFINSASKSAIEFSHLCHLREVRNFKKNGQFSDDCYEKCLSPESNCNESDIFSQDIYFEKSSTCVLTDDTPKHSKIHLNHNNN